MNRLDVYSLPTVMSSLTGNHTMDLFYLLTYVLINLLITEGASRICLIYQVVRCHKDENSEEYARTHYEALNQTLLTQKHRSIRGRLPIHFTVWKLH